MHYKSIKQTKVIINLLIFKKKKLNVEQAFKCKINFSIFI